MSVLTDLDGKSEGVKLVGRDSASVTGQGTEAAALLWLDRSSGPFHFSGIGKSIFCL